MFFIFAFYNCYNGSKLSFPSFCIRPKFYFVNHIEWGLGYLLLFKIIVFCNFPQYFILVIVNLKKYLCRTFHRQNTEFHRNLALYFLRTFHHIFLVELIFFCNNLLIHQKLFVLFRYKN